MKCPKCGRTGKEYWNGNVFCNTGFECDKCNGTGNVEQTNEEWRKTCSAEEFAESLTKVVLNMVSWNNDPRPSEVRNVLKTWLKQPHTTTKE